MTITTITFCSRAEAENMQPPSPAAAVLSIADSERHPAALRPGWAFLHREFFPDAHLTEFDLRTQPMTCREKRSSTTAR